MFTGIVTDVGRVRAVRDTNRDRRFEIETAFDLSTIDIGASVSHAGCCLTVVEKGDGLVRGGGVRRNPLAHHPGRLGRGQAGQSGARRPRRRRTGRPHRLRPRGRHGRGAVDRERGRIAPVRIRVPRPLHRFIAPKGSITVEGVS
jgi:riboflavin synthase